MAQGKKLTSKGFLGGAISLVTKGWLAIARKLGREPYPPRDFCDYPHATKIATRGRIASGLGIATQGIYYKICIEEIPFEERTTGPGRRGFREEEQKKKDKQKLIKITVWAYDKKWETEHVVSDDVRVSATDVEVVDKGPGMIEVNIRNLKNESDII